MMRLIALPLLVTMVGLAMPLTVTYGQPTATTVQHEADRARAEINGAWTQAQGETKERWGKLTDNDIKELDGRREVLIGKLQTRYSISFEDAERQVGDFEARRP